ncbi:MAG: hypothetical protein ACREBT_00860 [Thermoplasmata archaeon]
MIVETLSDHPRVVLVGAVRGLYSETFELIDRLESSVPSALGLAVSPEELEGLTTYFAHAEAETTVHLVETEQSEIQALTRWGEVRVPNPTHVRAIEWAHSRGVTTHALDPSDEGAAEMFRANIGYVELVRRTLAERKLARSPPEADSPDAFAERWDRQLARGTGSRELALDRDRYLVGEVRSLERSTTSLVVVVDRERFPQVRRLLADETS